METKEGRARVPARVTIQMTHELRDKLQVLARREYGGDLQVLLRETLQARVDGEDAGTDQMTEILHLLACLRQEVAGRDEEAVVQVGQLLERAEMLGSRMAAIFTEIMVTHDHIEKAVVEIAKLNAERRPE